MSFRQFIIGGHMRHGKTFATQQLVKRAEAAGFKVIYGPIPEPEPRREIRDLDMELAMSPLPPALEEELSPMMRLMATPPSARPAQYHPIFINDRRNP